MKSLPDEDDKVIILEKINLYMNRFLLVIGGIAVLALMALATGNVILRMFGMPYEGTYEFVSFLGAIVIATALGYTQHKKDNIVVNILSDKFPEPVKRIVDAISSLISIIFFSIVSWQVLVWGMNLAEYGEVSETLKIIYHPFVYCVSAGFAVLSLTYFTELLVGLVNFQSPTERSPLMDESSGCGLLENAKEERI